MKEIIESERLRLRKIQESDDHAIFEKWCQDSLISKYMTWKPHETIGETREFISFCLNGWDNDHYTWVIENKATNEIIGCFDATKDRYKLDVGYLLIESQWGQGFMPEILKTFIRLVFSDKDIFRIGAVCDIDNVQSKKVMEKSGMQYEGVLKAWLIHPNLSSAPRDCHSLSITNKVLFNC